MIVEIEVHLLEGIEPFYVEVETEKALFQFVLRDGVLSFDGDINALKSDEYMDYILVTRIPDLEAQVNAAVDAYVESERAELLRMAARAKMKEAKHETPS